MSVAGFSLLAGDLGYSQRRYFVDAFHLQHIPALPSNSIVLDLGGHKTRKRGQFDIHQYNLAVTYANLTSDRQPDVQSDAAYLPFAGSCFDAVICAELLEHVPNPLLVLNEAYRVLRPQGILLITVPFLFRIHGDPYDYGRYTDFFWEENLARVGFGEIIIERQGAFWSVLVDMLRDRAYEATVKEGRCRSRVIRKLLRSSIGWARRKALQWDQRHVADKSPFFSSYTTGFGIRATKS